MLQRGGKNQSAVVRNVVLISSDGVRRDRELVLRWARRLNDKKERQKLGGGSTRQRVGGVVSVSVLPGSGYASSSADESPADAKNNCDHVPRRFLKSIASGEVRWFPDRSGPEAQAELTTLYEWAREEIMVALAAGVEVLVIDEIGPEVIHGMALDAALRACLWKAGEEELETLFLVVVEPSMMDAFEELYGISRDDSVHRSEDFRSFVKWEALPGSLGDKVGSKNRARFNWRNKFALSHDVNLSEDMDARDSKEQYDHAGEGPFYSLIRLPLLFTTLSVVFAELIGYVFVRNLVSLIESISTSHRSHRQRLNAATHFSSWRRAARELDLLEAKSGGNVEHIPAIEGFTASLGTLTKQLASENRRESKRLLAGNKEQASVPGPSRTIRSSEHEIISCLQACTTTIVEMVNEHLYSMNNQGINHEMRDCVASYVRALEQVEASQHPGVLSLRTWQSHTRLIELDALKKANATNSMLGMAQDALGDVTDRILKSPMRATLAALRSSTALASADGTGEAELSCVSTPQTATGDGEVASQNAEIGPGGDVLVGRNNSIDELDATHPDSHSVSSSDSIGAVAAAAATHQLGKAKVKSQKHNKMVPHAHSDPVFAHSKNLFFSELAHAYGETALCLSGGAGNAYYHLGVIRTLLRRKLLPRHITGASGGALVGAFTATRTDDELRAEMRAENLCKIFDPCSPGGMPSMLRRLARQGTLFDVDDWIAKLTAKVCGTMTFQEAFEKTGRSFTITVYNIDSKGRNHTRILNYKTTPDVVIFSAVLASSALPKLLPPIELLRKDGMGNITEYHSMGKFWRDGSFENELPFEALRQLFNVTFPIVSQVEPHISPFFYDNRGSAGKSVAHRNGKGWRGGFLLAYCERLIKLDLRKWLELVRDFNLLPKVHDTDISKVFLGRTRGSVTLVPPILVKSYMNLVADPNTPQKMERYLTVGSQMAWPKLGMIEDRLAIERTLQHLASQR